MNVRQSILAYCWDQPEAFFNKQSGTSSNDCKLQCGRAFLAGDLSGFL